MSKESSKEFVIHVYSNQHDTYQGDISWLKSGKKVYFKSFLELMELLAEAGRFG